MKENEYQYMWHFIEKKRLSQYRFCKAFLTEHDEYEDELRFNFELP